MKRITTIFTICYLAISMIAQFAAAENASKFAVKSPDQRNCMTLEYDAHAGVLTYAISRDDKPIIMPTPISITIDGVKYSDPGWIFSVSQKAEESLRPVVPSIAAETRFPIDTWDVSSNSPVRFHCLATNEGFAFSWSCKLQENEEIVVNDEQFAMNFAKDFEIYFPEPNGNGFFSHQEPLYPKMRISETKGKKTATTPVLVELDQDAQGEQQYLMITDVNVVGYPGMWLEGTDTTTMKGVFPHFPEKVKEVSPRAYGVEKYSDYLAQLSEGLNSTPARLFILSDAKGLLTCTLPEIISRPPAQDRDWSWIKPGKVSWDWWNDWNLSKDDVDFEPGVNQATYKHYIDFASENDLPYIILDEGWSEPGIPNLLKVVPELDIAELSAYAKSKNVGLILWMTSSALEASYDEAFEQFTEWNIKGLKIDFMQRDDQAMMDFLYQVAEEAADRHMLVDYHGGSKPAGITTTWPNVITIEAVQGLEQCKWGGNASPEMAVTIPFIRMVVGPLDYTPGAMVNKGKDEFKPDWHAPSSQGTRCQQLAMYVVFRSPLQMLADTPSNYRKNPGSLAFLRDVPTTWDETVALDAVVGDYVALARRNGDNWYVGAMTDWTPRELKLSLDFLGDGKYTMTSYSDGTENATGDVVGVEKTVSAADTVTVKMNAGGGFAASFEPVK